MPDELNIQARVEELAHGSLSQDTAPLDLGTGLLNVWPQEKGVRLTVATTAAHHPLWSITMSPSDAQVLGRALMNAGLQPLSPA